MTTHPHDAQSRLTRPMLDAILTEIGGQFGIDVRNAAELVKFTNNAVFRLASAPVVIRIAGSATMRRRIPKIIQVARWFQEHDAPTTRLLDGVPQPVEVRGHLATLWHLVSETGPRPTGTDLANVLLRLHALPAPSFDLPLWWPFDEIRQRLAEADGVDPADLAFLLDCCEALEQQLRGVEYVLPPGPIHGDATVGNVLAGPDGPVICDFDSVSHGPREWDLTPVALGRLRFNYAGDAHTELARQYGFDVMQWRGFDVLRQIRELKLVTSVVPVLASNPVIRDQWSYRLRTFKEGDPAPKWTTYR